MVPLLATPRSQVIDVHDFREAVQKLSLGLTEQEIWALTQPVDAHTWSEGDRALIAMADDLAADDCVSDATWHALQVRWENDALIEMLVLAGTYRLVSGFLNSTGVQLDPGVPGWPDPPTS